MLNCFAEVFYRIFFKIVIDWSSTDHRLTIDDRYWPHFRPTNRYLQTIVPPLVIGVDLCKGNQGNNILFFVLQLIMFNDAIISKVKNYWTTFDSKRVTTSDMKVLWRISWTMNTVVKNSLANTLVASQISELCGFPQKKVWITKMTG